MTKKRIKRQTEDIEKNFPKFIQIIRAFYFQQNNISGTSQKVH